LELLVKERLTGAIILVVLIVLLVPELLSGPKGPAVSAHATGAAPTSSEEPPLRSYTINLGDDSHSQSETASGAAGTTGPAMPQPSGPAQPTTPTGSPQAGTQSADATESSTWDSPTANGQSTSPSTAVQPGNSATEGPTPQQPSSRDQQASRTIKSSTPQANAAAQKSAAAASSQKPASSTTAAAARSEPSKPARTAAASADKPSKGHPATAANTTSGSESGGWGVQLGVFASRENAERLALDVRVKGFKVSVSPVSSGKRKLYRVRVGPTADRSGAQELLGRLKAAGRPDGKVVPYS